MPVEKIGGLMEREPGEEKGRHAGQEAVKRLTTSGTQDSDFQARLQEEQQGRLDNCHSIISPGHKTNSPCSAIGDINGVLVRVTETDESLRHGKALRGTMCW
jgi:hypothetical protein